jgi:hypothetical protein
MKDSSRNHNVLKECSGKPKNQGKCPESICSFVVITKRNKTLHKKGLETDTEEKAFL